jgi:hypothetical protein
MLYKILISLVLLYGSETSAISKAEEKRTKLLERRILKKHLQSDGGGTILVDDI